MAPRSLSTLAFALAAAACSVSPSNAESNAPTCAQASLMVAASDEQYSSELGTLALDGGSPTFYTAAELGYDPALASSNGRVFWINRTSGNVVELDPNCAAGIRGPWP